MLDVFNCTCTDILDLVAPFKCKRSEPVTEVWLNDTTCTLRCTCRRAKRKWKKDCLQVSLEILKNSQLEYQRAIKAAKSLFLSYLVSINSHKPQFLFNTLNFLLNPCDHTGAVPSPKLHEDFLRFFIDKISAIRSSLLPIASHPAVSPICPAVFESFEQVSVSALTNLVHHLRPSYCPTPSL